MIGVEKTDGVLIEEYSLRLLERQAMLAHVLPILGPIPFESHLSHMYNVHIFPWVGKAFLVGENEVVKPCPPGCVKLKSRQIAAKVIDEHERAERTRFFSCAE